MKNDFVFLVQNSILYSFLYFFVFLLVLTVFGFSFVSWDDFEFFLPLVLGFVVVSSFSSSFSFKSSFTGSGSFSVICCSSCVSFVSSSFAVDFSSIVLFSVLTCLSMIPIIFVNDTFNLSHFNRSYENVLLDD